MTIKPMNILILSAGRRVSLTRFFRRELANAGLSAKVLTADANPEMSSACHENESFLKLPRLSEPTYRQELENMCLNNAVGLVIPTIDTELPVLAELQSSGPARTYRFVVSSPDVVGICSDKRLTHDLFLSRGVKTPKIFAKESPEFPLFAKPYDGSNSKDLYLVRRPDQITDEIRENDKLVYFQYLDRQSHDEYTVDAYYDKKGVLRSAVPRQRIEVRGGEVSKSVTVRDALLDLMRSSFSRWEGAVGCMTFQFFRNRNTGEYFGIEINARFGGGYPLSYHSGAVYPRYLIDEYLLNKELEAGFDFVDQNVMLRYDDEVIFKRT